MWCFTSLSAMLLRTGTNMCRPAAGVFTEYARAISVTSTTSRGKSDKYDEFFFEREYEKAKTQMDPDMDDPTDIIQKMKRDQTRRERAIKYARAARLFPQPQEERRLTRDTMEQIRFLKQENPEEWSIPRLAKSFQVSQNVIIKVLKSKFVPTEKTKQKQDLQAKINAGLLPPGSTVDVEESTDVYISAPSSTKLLGDGHLPKGMLGAGQSQSTHHKSVYQNKQGQEQSKAKSKQINRHEPDKNNVVTQAYGTTDRYHASQYQKKNPQEIPNKSFQTHRREKGSYAKKRQKQHVKPNVNDDDATRLVKIADEYDSADEDDFVDYEEDIPDEPLKVIQKGRAFYDESGEFLYRV